MNFISERVKNIKPSPTLAVVKKAAELKAKGIDIISLGAGEPDFDTPKHIKESAIKAINEGFTKYTPVDGAIDLKQAIAKKFERDNNLSYSLEQITVGAGGKQILFNAFFASLNPGDEVIIPAPYWVSYPDMVLLADGVPVFIEGKSENGFRITPADLEKAITNKTKWVIINSPSNPSGAGYTATQLKELANVLLKYDHVGVISDDIYEYIVFDNFKFSTMAEVEPKLMNRTLTINGASKSYSMTGWRLGYGAGPAELIRAMNNIQSQSTSNASSISQKAALAGLLGPQDFLADGKILFRKRRDLVVNLLNDIKGIKCNFPEGAFYVFPSCEGLLGKKTPNGNIIKDSNDLASYFLEDANVAVVAGIAFGMDGFFRISYATSDEILIESCKRIKEAVDKLT